MDNRDRIRLKAIENGTGEALIVVMSGMDSVQRVVPLLSNGVSP